MFSSKNKINLVLFSSLLFSLFAFSASFYFQYSLGLQPCHLCLWQRWPFIVGMTISFYGLISKKDSLVLWVLLLFFIFEVSISSYHLLIQLQVVKDPCIIAQVNNVDTYWRMLHSPLSCSKITWKMFGLPISLINTTVCLIFIILISYSLNKQKFSIDEKSKYLALFKYQK